MQQEIDLLVAFLWSVKKLSFGKDELTVSGVLEQNNILTIEGDNYEIKNYSAVAPGIMKAFKQKIAFADSTDFSQSVTLIRNLEKTFEENGHVAQFYRLERELWKLIVLEANKSYADDFHEYIETLNMETRYDELFGFIEAYSEVLPALKLDADTIYKNTIHLRELTTGRDGNRQYPLAILFWGLGQVSESDEKKGENLLQIALQDTPVQIDVFAAIVAGLYSKRRVAFYHQQLASLFEKEEFRVPIIESLSSVRELTESDVELFLELIDKAKVNAALHLSIVNLLFSILSDANNFSGKEKYVAVVFHTIQELAATGQEELTYRILHRITFLHTYDEERIETVVSVLQQPYFTLEKYGKAIGGIFLYLRSLSLLKNVLFTIASHHPFIPISRFFEIAHGRFDKSAYDEMLIDFITNDKAGIRFIGIDLFTHHSMRVGYTFDKNILDLEPIRQYKLWVCLTQDYKEPQYFLPALFPLLHSTSDTVKEAFIGKLEEYTRNYGTQVIKILEGRIDKTSESDIAILERIKNYHRSFYEENIAPKEHLKELNPFYTHNKLFANFNKLHFKTFNSRMHKSVEENSLLSIFGKSIQLAKGGGWKFGGQDTISKLGSIESSFSLPRDYFIFPNQFELEESRIMKTDWEAEDFAFIQEIIKNEQQ